MTGDTCVYDLLVNGEVLFNIDGGTVEQIYADVCKKAKLPEGLEESVLLDELLQREKVLSTAVGNCIAIPHPRRPLVDSPEKARLIIAYPKNPIDMQAPDQRKVTVLFVLLSCSTKFHISALSSIAKLVKNSDVLKKIQMHPPKETLLELVRSVEMSE